MDIKLFLIIFGGIGAIAVLFRIIFGFIPKGNEIGKTAKLGCSKEGKAVTDESGLSSPFWDSTSTFYIE